MLKKYLLRGFVVLASGLLFLSLLTQPETIAAYADDDLDQNRARLLTYVLRRQVENHFSAKPVDNQLSRAVFNLYLKQLDYQKRLLLTDEVKQLRIFEERIDDEISSGKIVLAPMGAGLIRNSIHRAEQLVTEILATPFDFQADEDYETDPEKLQFCATLAELRERWRTDLKFQVLNRYLTLMEDAELDDPAQITGEQHARLEQEARDKVAKQYADYFDRLLQETVKDHFDRYLNTFARAFDPHTTYLPPQTKEDFDISMRGSLEGIGATLREEDGFIRIVKIIPGSAADRQGQLHADDVILAVGEGAGEPVDVTDMRLRDAVALIRGKKGTEVRLTIRRPGHKPFVVPIVRDVVIIEESFVKSVLVTHPDSGSKFGYIKIPSFYRDFEMTRNGGEGRNSTDDVKAALEKLNQEQISGLILDLRNNGGGALTDAVGVTGLFIEKGPVVQVRDGDGQTKVLYDHDPYIGYTGPMVVLVNQFSASASEIVAGALQDYGRAIIVGSDHTHGKGTVQIVMDLDRSMTLRNMQQYMPLGALKMTTQMFYRVSGDSTQYRGIVPDIVLPDRSKYNEFGERYLDHSLPWDAIPAVDYVRWPSAGGIDDLVKHSRERVSRDAEFDEISRQAKVVAERIRNTRQSLQIDRVYRERSDRQWAGNSPHGMGGLDAEGTDDGRQDDRDATLSDAEKLLRAVKEDPYARESMAILADLLELEMKVAGHPAN